MTIDWFEHAQDGDHLTTDMLFLFCDSYYHGPDTSRDVEEVREKTVPLIKVDYSFLGHYGVCFKEIYNEPSSFTNYLNQLKELSIKYKKPLLIGDSLLWIRPVLHDGKEKRVSFSWTDTFVESLIWRNSIMEKTSEDVFWDVDQGWLIEIYQDNKSFFYRQSDPDTTPEGDEIANYRITKELHRNQVKDVWERAVLVLELAKRECGIDLTTAWGTNAIL